MENDEQDAPEVLETPAPEAETVTPEVEEAEAETPEQLRAKLDEERSKNAQLYERAKKAEAKAKESPVAPSNDNQLTPKDAVALVKAGITDDEDVEEVVRYAGYAKLPVGQAIKDKTLQAILSTRSEERRTAQATQTKGAARGTSKVSPEDLLSKAQRGEDIAPEDIDKLFAARTARRFVRRGK